MKFLVDRTEIATAINFGKYPVLSIDVPGDKLDKYVKGCRVRVGFKNCEYGELTTNGNLYFENGRFAISNDDWVISSTPSYYDGLEEMISDANSPLVHAGDIVVVVVKFPEHKNFMVKLMKVHNSINISCSTVAVLDEIGE